MSWKDKLQPASFRNVPFKVAGHELSGGRRIAKHEFAMRDTPYAEDMGRKSKDFSVDAYIVGDDYMTGRDALMRACDAFGPGELIHPYYGTISVNCDGFTLRETSSEGRICRFTLKFVESGQSETPASEVDGIAEAAACYATAKKESIADFIKSFKIGGLPDFALTDATKMIKGASDTLANIAASINTVASGKEGFLQPITAFSASISGLLATPGILANSLHSLFGTVTSLFDDPLIAAKKLQSMFGFGGDAVPFAQSTSTRIQQADNRSAIFALVNQAAVMESARIAPTATFSTVNDAQALRDAITLQIDTLMDDPLMGDATYTALQAVRANIVNNLPPASVSLPNIVDYVPLITLPALVIAHDIYGDASRDLEIVARNNIAHPGFVPGGVALQVIANV